MVGLLQCATIQTTRGHLTPPTSLTPPPLTSPHLISPRLGVGIGLRIAMLATSVAFAYWLNPSELSFTYFLKYRAAAAGTTPSLSAQV